MHFVSNHHYFTATRIIIAGGKNESSLSSAYILNIVFDINGEIYDVSYDDLDDMPQSCWMSFYQKCGDRIFIGGGRGVEPWDQLNQVVEFNEDKWKSFPSLNTIRDKCPASCFVNNILIVAGGYEPTQGRLNSIEYIDITDEEDTAKEWTLSKSVLPVRVLAHTLSELNGKIYLIGGNVGNLAKQVWISNRVWMGTLNSRNEFEFQEVCSMREERLGHFSIVVGNQIHVFGGEKNVLVDRSSVEVFDGNKWSQGPDFPFLFNTSNSSAVLNRNGLIVITTSSMELTGYHGIFVYNPFARTVKLYPNFILREPREYYSSILLQ